MLPVSIAVAVAALVLAGWAAVHAVRGVPTSGRQVVGAGVVEALLLVAVIATIFAQSGGHVTGDPIVLWGYLITALFILPVAVAWAFVDRTRTSAVAMAVCAVTVAIMMWRVLEIAALA